MRKYKGKSFVKGLGLCMVLLPMVIRADKPIARPVLLRRDMAAALELTQEQADAMREQLEQVRREWEQGADIPTASEVGAPVPPGISYMGKGTIARMRYVNLVSTETSDAIRRWYAKRLQDMPGWQRSDEFGVFYRAEGALTLPRYASLTLPVIEIKDVDPNHLLFLAVDRDVMAGLKALIQITYPGADDSEDAGDKAEQVRDWVYERMVELFLEEVDEPADQAIREAAEKFGMSLDDVRDLVEE